MRIRQIKPSFWKDARLAKLPLEDRMVYVGLWMMADDAGWFRWDVAEIGAELLPYEPVKRREATIRRVAGKLVDTGRLVHHECSHSVIPRLSDHQVLSGGKALTTIFKEHQRCTGTGGYGAVRTSTAGTERNGTERGGPAVPSGTAADDLQSILENPATPPAVKKAASRAAGRG